METTCGLYCMLVWTWTSTWLRNQGHNTILLNSFSTHIWGWVTFISFWWHWIRTRFTNWLEFLESTPPSIAHQKRPNLLEVTVVGSTPYLMNKDTMLSSIPNLCFHLLVEVKQHGNNMLIFVCWSSTLCCLFVWVGNSCGLEFSMAHIDFIVLPSINNNNYVLLASPWYANKITHLNSSQWKLQWTTSNHSLK